MKDASKDFLTDEDFIKSLDSKRDNIISYNASRKNTLNSIKSLKEELLAEKEELKKLKAKLRNSKRLLIDNKISLKKTQKAIRLERNSINKLSKRFTSVNDSNLNVNGIQKIKK